MEEKIKNFTNDYFKEKGSTSIKNLNIVLVGPNGVWRSILINSALELDEALYTKEGEAEPCTMGIPVYYNSAIVNFIRVADSGGIEKSHEYGVDQVIKDIKEFIEGQLLTKHPDRYVNCIWHCITELRSEDVENESLVELSKIYDNNKLPIIIVNTKAMVPDLYKPIEKKIKDLKLDLEFVSVISKDIEIEEECEEENKDETESKKIKKKLVIKNE